jgi:sugar phosphate isomerase/epimerase
MLIGTMNHPSRDIFEEMQWMADVGMEFIDMTLEPPRNASWMVDTERVRTALDRHRFQIVGHTPFYLPIASAIDEVRRGAVAELRRCLRVFSELGAKWMNIHPDHYTPFHDRPFFVQRNIDSLKELHADSERYGVGLMIENLPGNFNSAQQMGDLLDPLPWLGLHLDFGHSNLLVPRNTAVEMLEQYGARLRHVHIHDNKGGSEDLHLPLGVGNNDVGKIVAALKQCHYNGTITLEVFTPDHHFLTYSADVLRRAWREGAAAA